MSTSFAAPEHDRWGKVFELLVELSVNYNRETPAPWRLSAPIRGGLPDWRFRFQELEAPVVDELVRAIDHLLKSETLEDVSERTKYWLGLRVDACILFASWLSVKGGFIPAPCVPTEQLARFLLVDWWQQHGAAFVTTLDQGGFPGIGDLRAK